MLTARHCVEGLIVKNLSVRFGFQEKKGYVDYGFCIQVDGWIQESVENDYVILRLDLSALCFKPLSLELSRDAPFGSSVLLHHPGSMPKQVSVHASLESEHYMYTPAAFHDSTKGSSGGVYVNAGKKIFALHLWKGGTTPTTGARYMRDIWDRSFVLKNCTLKAVM